MPSKIRGGNNDKHMADTHVPRVSSMAKPDGAAAFAPTDISGLYQWYAARKESGFVDNDAVGTAVNFATGASNATQGTAGAKPTFKTNIKNGQPVFRFDGGDYLGFTDYTVTSGTVFVVCKLAATGTDCGIIANAATSASIVWHSGSRMYWIDDAGNLWFVSYVQDTNWHIFTIQDDNSQILLRNNGAQVGVSPNNPGTLTLNAFGLRWGTDGFNGDIPEILVYRNTILTAPQIEQVETYLNDLYAAY